MLADLNQIPSYQAETLNLSMRLENGLSLLINQNLSQEVKSKIWLNQLFSLVFITFAAAIIYFTYNKLFVLVIARNIYQNQYKTRTSIKGIML